MKRGLLENGESQPLKSLQINTSLFNCDWKPDSCAVTPQNPLLVPDSPLPSGDQHFALPAVSRHSSGAAAHKVDCS